MTSLYSDSKMFEGQQILNEKDKSKKKFKFQNGITFSNVEFKFSSNNEKTLENINFEIKKNDFIAIVGKTGTGKTTFLNLFMGLLKPSSGK